MISKEKLRVPKGDPEFFYLRFVTRSYAALYLLAISFATSSVVLVPFAS